MSETSRILKGIPTIKVGIDQVPLCVRLDNAISSGRVEDLGRPISTKDSINFTPPRTATFSCAIPACVKICEPEGTPPASALSVNQLVDPEGGFVPNQYVMPPAADLILQCGELASRVLSAEAPTGQQG